MELNIIDNAVLTTAKILIVDDEPDIIDEVVEQLEDEGLVCVSAYNAAQALELIEADTAIGVVVTDIRMPGMGGLEMARKLSDDYGDSRDLFVIVVTGHAGMKEAIEALQLGAEDFLTKPISPDHLLHSVRRAGEMIHLRANERFYQQKLEQQVQAKTTEVRELAADLAARNQELRTKNRELTVVSQLKDEFLQMMSHELNTPLNAIIGFSQLLMDSARQKADDKAEKCASHIYSSGMRLMKTFDSIITLSSLTAGNFNLTPSRFSARNFIDSTISEFTPMLDNWKADLQCDMPERPFDMTADFQELLKAVGHLIENAAKYGNEGGKVHLTISRKDGQVVFAVTDNGPGMTAKQAAIAQEPMRQVDGSLARKYEGMGLGLPLARAIAELHGGRLDVDSTPGSGTTVTITVPEK